jgi:hypothetical protein
MRWKSRQASGFAQMNLRRPTKAASFLGKRFDHWSLQSNPRASLLTNLAFASIATATRADYSLFVLRVGLSNQQLIN